MSKRFKVNVELGYGWTNLDEQIKERDKNACLFAQYGVDEKY